MQFNTLSPSSVAAAQGAGPPCTHQLANTEVPRDDMVPANPNFSFHEAFVRKLDNFRRNNSVSLLLCIWIFLRLIFVTATK